MEKILVITEKPSVARDIAAVIGAHHQGRGCIQGDRYIVTWAVGHLVTLPEPHEINSQWKTWRKNDLPLLPTKWPLQIIQQTQSQFEIIKNLFENCQKIICATDAGREGELIFRYIYEAAQCKKPFQRLWISSLTSDAIRAGFENLQEGKKYDSLADAARARSCADWLIGMNLSRAYTLTSGEKYFVGRVQTPTLALIAQRDKEIRDFKPESYYELSAKFSTTLEDATPEDVTKNAGNPYTTLKKNQYRGFYVGEIREFFPPQPIREKRFPPDGELVKKILERVSETKASIHSVQSKVVHQAPPLLYDLTELQRHANRLFNYSAAATLEIAQSLYEKHKLISYPRTDSRYLSQSVAQTVGPIASFVRTFYPLSLAPGTAVQPLPSRFINDAEVSDHHAIIPTLIFGKNLKEEEQKIYDLICRRLLSAWQGDYVTSVTSVLTLVDTYEKDLFRSQGTIIQNRGWKILELKEEGFSAETFLPLLTPDQEVFLFNPKMESKTTRPPPHLTDSTLLTAMETAGRFLDDRDLANIIKQSGLGTPATRAGIIETLFSRGYIERKGKTLTTTLYGQQLIETVHPSVKSAELTARWEKELQKIRDQKESMQEFLAALRK